MYQVFMKMPAPVFETHKYLNEIHDSFLFFVKSDCENHNIPRDYYLIEGWLQPFWDLIKKWDKGELEHTKETEVFEFTEENTGNYIAVKKI